MLKPIIITIVLFCLSISGFAQNSVKGRVIDEKGEPLSYATVALLNPVDSTLKFFGVTNNKGIYQIKHIKTGKYIMQFSFVGMDVIYENITIPAEKGEDLGDKTMKASLLDEVIIVAEYVPVKFKSDTVEFNTKAFETKPDAVVEDLLKKIPGVEVDEAGNVKAMGEDVQEVLVDGKEFFGKDLKVATKNLPADAVDKVQVYDKKTYEAVFMGVDDGVRDRTINLLLKEDRKKGYFGNLEAGPGTEEHYKIGGKIYKFSKKYQAAFLGMYNNINEFGHSGHGKGHWGQQINGLNTTIAGGMNLSFNPTKYNRYFISYLASSTKTTLEQKTSTENFIIDGSYFQNKDLIEDERDTPHKINFGIRHNFNKSHNLTFDGDISISANDVVSNMLTNTSVNDTLINSLNNSTDNLSDLTNAEARAVYIFKLNKEKTQVKTNFKVLYNKSISDFNWSNITTIFNPNSIDVVDQYQDNNTEEFNVSINPTFVQQITKFWHISANVNIGSKNENLSRKYGLKNETTYIDSLSPDFKTIGSFVKPALSLQRSTNKSQLQFTLGAGWDEMDKEVWEVSIGNKSYFHILPGFSYENSYRKGRRIKFGYNSGVNMPNVNQLIPVANTINPLSIYQGNTNLTPEYNHNLSFSWSIFDQFSFTSMFSRIGAAYTENKISMSQTVNENLVKLITPENVPYNYNVYSFIYFSTPIRSLGIKINAISHESWNKGISIVNSSENINTSFTHSIKLNVENRIKEKWDVMIGGSVSLTDSKLSISESLNNVYYNTSFFSDIRFTPNETWSFETKANIVNYNTENFNESLSMPMLSAGISFFFLKDKKASLSVNGVDLLDKSANIVQISETNYLMYQESNAIGRYVMLRFKLKVGR